MRCIIVQIKRIDPHPDAHSLDQIYFDVDGQEQMLVTGRHYNVGGLGIFIPVGSMVPDKLLKEMWLEGKLGGPNKNVVTGIRKRGIWSNGLFYGQENENFHAYWNESWTVGQDVTEEIGVTYAGLAMP